jgi:chromate transporter
MSKGDQARALPAATGSPAEVLKVALNLGLTSFGGPIAHLGYFERTYVRERRWLSSDEYGSVVSLCQLLPGPTSSQVGFLVGLHRAGWLGALAAWVGFTLPSALLMYAFALIAPAHPGVSMQAILHGLMLTAVVIVAQAVWNMWRSLAPDMPRRIIAIVACTALLFLHGGLAQLLTLLAGAFAGALVCRSVSHPADPPPAGLPPSAARAVFAIFLALLIGLSGAALLQTHGPVALASIFFRSGAFVFGGGHVVLPLLQQALVPGWVSGEEFLAGYGFAQAMPGPLFSVASFLGAVSAPPHQSLLWAIEALIAIFLPGLLLAAAGFSVLGRIMRYKIANATLAGINAAVVGLLAAALYNPVWVNAVRSAVDVVIALVAFILLLRFKAPPILIAALCVGASLAGFLARS